MIGTWNSLTRDGVVTKDPAVLVTLKYQGNTLDTYGFHPSSEGELLDAMEYRVKKELGLGILPDMPDGWVAIVTGKLQGTVVSLGGEWLSPENAAEKQKKQMQQMQTQQEAA